MGRTYTTVQGDLWDSIAYKQCGSTAYTGKLMALNRAWRDTFLFPAGVTLELPEPETQVNRALPPWKKGTP